EDARDVEGDVAVAHHGDRLSRERPVARVVGVAVVPAHEIGRAEAARQLDAGDLEPRVAHRPGREDDGVVVPLEVVERDVAAVGDVAEDADVAAVDDGTRRTDAALGARMVGGDAVAHEPVRRGQLLEQVDRHVEAALVLQQDVRGVDPGGSGSHDREAELHETGSFLCADGAVGGRGAARWATQPVRSTIAWAKRVSDFLTGPTGSGSSAATASSAQRRASARVAAVTGCACSSATAAVNASASASGAMPASRRASSAAESASVSASRRRYSRGRVGTPARRSVPASLPVWSIALERSITSSTSWKATPTRSPNSSTGVRYSSGAFEKMTPMTAAQEMGEPVLSASTCR